MFFLFEIGSFWGQISLFYEAKLFFVSFRPEYQLDICSELQQTLLEQAQMSISSY